MKVKKFIVKGIQEKCDKYEFTLKVEDIDKDWCRVFTNAKLKESEKAEQHELVVIGKNGKERGFQSWIPKSCLIHEAVPAEADTEIPFN